MKNDGYIRKIDELGRVVIPKEVRKKLKIQNDENIIINYDNSKIYLTKFSYISNNYKFICDIANFVQEIYKLEIIVCDRENIIFNSLNTDIYISDIETRNLSVFNQKYIIYKDNIISESVIVGCICLLSVQENDEFNRLIKFISNVVGIYLQQT